MVFRRRRSLEIVHIGSQILRPVLRGAGGVLVQKVFGRRLDREPGTANERPEEHDQQAE